jgi:hypothetical protein
MHSIREEVALTATIMVPGVTTMDTHTAIATDTVTVILTRVVKLTGMGMDMQRKRNMDMVTDILMEVTGILTTNQQPTPMITVTQRVR